MEPGLAYLHDGSLEGLLSAVFAAYERHEDPDEVVAEGCYEPRFGQEFRVIPTSFERADRVRRGVERAAGRRAFKAILQAAACEDYGAGTVVYRFIRHVMGIEGTRRARAVLNDLANPVVADLVALEKHTVNECENMRQFVRFSHLGNGVWFARCNPNASVVPLVMGHFAARMGEEPFILYDEAHQMAGVYDGRDWSLVKGEVANVPAASERDGVMEEAWRRFYDALSVEARYNPELRRQLMPCRLWKNLPEQPGQAKPSHPKAVLQFDKPAGVAQR